eukprot:TRINITY_DN43507_c0_g1_i1.p1 TRINITY_DN43507_c0_g1~~TRINITY_DN43507_c0_g1_i1.p1  ORF type:complete len:217 (+),score=29.10 TRINITY_DN43507_c0_g1_i1:41-652(+)
MAPKVIRTAAEAGSWNRGARFTQCWAHGKKRSLTSLTTNGAGGMVCRPGDECQASSNDREGPRTRSRCSTHGKVRSTASLVDDGLGGFTCIAEDSCKQTGDRPVTSVGFSVQDGQGPKGATALPRQRITQEMVTGHVLEWKGKHGWLALDLPIEHPAASMTPGRVYLNFRDLVQRAEVNADAWCQFHVYVDASGLGAEECTIV